jgi:hypothetical protein
MSLRILMVSSKGMFRPYVSLITHLAERGHHVHLGFPREAPDARERLLDLPADASTRITDDVSPTRRPTDGWKAVAWAVRGLADLARYGDPRYDAAPVLRARMARKVVGRLRKPRYFEPLGRRLALRLARRLASTRDPQLSRRVLRIATKLEEAIPTSKRIDRYIRRHAPDVVLVAGIVKPASSQVEFLKSARRLRIPSAIAVASWDNLTNKGLLKFVPERVFVWNDVQRREAVELHGIPSSRVVATGAQVFDDWFERTPTRSREDFVRELGLDSREPYVLYVCSSAFITDPATEAADPDGTAAEVAFVRRWIEALRSSSDERLRRIGVVVRPHPGVPRRWSEAGLERYENAVVWPPVGTQPLAGSARDDFFDSLVHSAAVVGLNTTAMIEAAIVGKSVLTVLAPEFAQEETLHFHYLLEENGGFLHFAPSVDDHLRQLGRVLDEDVAGAERRRQFVESFVRPHGLERPATPIFADAIEELARLPVEVPARTGTAILRAVLAVEAALNSVALTLRHVTRARSARPAGRRVQPRPERHKQPAKAASVAVAPWEQLDEVSEYRAACAARGRHLVEVREPLVLVSQVQRSGGTLLSQLFDGHPECHAHPGEIYIGKPRKWDWPPLDLAAPESWFETLYEPLVTDYAREGYVKEKPAKGSVVEPDVFPFVFSPRLQKEIFDACVAERSIECERDVLDCYFTSYFNAWLDNHNLYSVPKRVLTGFTPRFTMEPGNVDRFFSAYPDGTLISLVRDPRAWYASAYKHRRYYRGDLDSTLELWRGSTAAAIDAAERYGERVLVLTYEELVTQTEATMARVAERIGIAMAPELLTPTFNGMPVQANSTEPAPRYGILVERVDAYRDVLDAATVERIVEQAGELYEHAMAVARDPRGQPVSWTR